MRHLRQPLLAVGQVGRLLRRVGLGDDLAVRVGALVAHIGERAAGADHATVGADERDVRIAGVEHERMLVGVHLLVLVLVRLQRALVVGRHVGEVHAGVGRAHDRAPVGAPGGARQRLVLQRPDLLVDHRAAEPDRVRVVRVDLEEQVVVALALAQLVAGEARRAVLAVGQLRPAGVVAGAIELGGGQLVGIVDPEEPAGVVEVAVEAAVGGVDAGVAVLGRERELGAIERRDRRVAFVLGRIDLLPVATGHGAPGARSRRTSRRPSSGRPGRARGR